MAKGASYDIMPSVPILKKGVLVKTKTDLYGSKAAGINAADENFDYSEEEVIIPAGEVCMYVEDRQFMAASNNKPMSAWIRCHMIANERIIWFTLLCEPKRLWDFGTFRTKEKKIKAELDRQFEAVGL